LAGVFTFEEETGMAGAANIAPEFLQGKYLLNCDNDSSGEFCIGCAGGARQTFTFTPQWCAPEAGMQGLKIILTGLPGGHSGSCIHDDRGNAIRFLAEFLDMHPEISLCAIDAGRVDNAIPAEAVAHGASTVSPAELQKLAAAFTLLVKEECPHAENMQLIISPAELPQQLWSSEFTRKLIPALALAPDGVLAMSEEFAAVRDSSNLAIIKSAPDAVTVSTSQRSLADAERDRICELIKNHFTMFGATAAMGNVYPATTPKPHSPLRETALQIRKIMKRPASVRVIHAGLESGWFSIKNPDLEIVSCGPHIEEYHTPRERLQIDSVAEFDTFLRLLLQQIASEQTL
jgi:dipeptidase D